MSSGFGRALTTIAFCFFNLNALGGWNILTLAITSNTDSLEVFLC